MSLPFTVPPPPATRKTYVDLNGTDEALRHDSNQAIGVANTWSVLYVTKPTRASFTVEETLLHISNSGNGDNQILVRLMGATANDPLRVLLTTSGGSTFKDLSWNDFFTTDVPVHLLITFDGAASGDPLVLYKNGAVVAATSGTDNTGTMADGNRRVCVGQSKAGANEFSGQIAEVAVWSSTLTAAEVAAIYAARRRASLANNFGAYVSGANLQHWWRLGLDSADIGKDYGHAGTLIDVMTNAANITSADVSTGYLV